MLARGSADLQQRLLDHADYLQKRRLDVSRRHGGGGVIRCARGHERRARRPRRDDGEPAPAAAVRASLGSWLLRWRSRLRSRSRLRWRPRLPPRPRLSSGLPSRSPLPAWVGRVLGVAVGLVAYLRRAQLPLLAGVSSQLPAAANGGQSASVPAALPRAGALGPQARARDAPEALR